MARPGQKDRVHADSHKDKAAIFQFIQLTDLCCSANRIGVLAQGRRHGRRQAHVPTVWSGQHNAKGLIQLAALGNHLAIAWLEDM